MLLIVADSRYSLGCWLVLIAIMQDVASSLASRFWVAEHARFSILDPSAAFKTARDALKVGGRTAMGEQPLPICTLFGRAST